MSEQRALLDAVLQSPEEDAPRLVYADWLEEHGEAELIRLQCTHMQQFYNKSALDRTRLDRTK